MLFLRGSKYNMTITQLIHSLLSLPKTTEKMLDVWQQNFFIIIF